MSRSFSACFCALLILLCACAVRSRAALRQVDSIVLHTIGGPRCDESGRVVFDRVGRDAAYWKQDFEKDPESKGIHWIVDRSGTVVASRPETEVAAHAQGNNATSIGIELVNDGSGLDPFPDAQLEALSALICEIRGRWPQIELAGIRGHGELDQRTLACGFKQKVDPGPAFPWSRALSAVARDCGR